MLSRGIRIKNTILYCDFHESVKQPAKEKKNDLKKIQDSKVLLLKKNIFCDTCIWSTCDS